MQGFNLKNKDIEAEVTHIPFHLRSKYIEIGREIFCFRKKILFSGKA